MTAPRTARPPGAQALADLLVIAAPELCEIANLGAVLRPLPAGQRIAAERWARAKITTRGQVERMPAMPPCIDGLYRRLRPAAEESSCR